MAQQGPQFMIMAVPTGQERSGSYGPFPVALESGQTQNTAPFFQPMTLPNQLCIVLPAAALEMNSANGTGSFPQNCTFGPNMRPPCGECGVTLDPSRAIMAMNTFNKNPHMLQNSRPNSVIASANWARLSQHQPMQQAEPPLEPPLQTQPLPQQQQPWPQQQRQPFPQQQLPQQQQQERPQPQPQQRQYHYQHQQPQLPRHEQQQAVHSCPQFARSSVPRARSGPDSDSSDSFRGQRFRLRNQRLRAPETTSRSSRRPERRQDDRSTPLARAADRASDSASPASSQDSGVGRPEKEQAQALVRQLQAVSSVSIDATYAVVGGHVLKLSLDSDGCREVQRLLDELRVDYAIELAGELEGHVLRTINSPHGNFVLQKMVENLPVKHMNFVAEELRGQGMAMARHRYGCRVLCRLVERHLTDARGEATRVLVDEVLDVAHELCRHIFGHHVVKAILLHGFHKDKQLVVKALRKNLTRAAKDKYAKAVLEQAMEMCGPQDREAIRAALEKRSSM